MPLKFFLAVIPWLLASNCHCIANNNLFLPGDAFFPTAMTKDEVNRFVMARSTERTITYAAIDKRGGAFCGWAGFDRLPKR
ncbi:hypothetical protein VN12_17920 [Pirellula sp. SH-Sr6A]|nr:hypothetical protein VN12_17920 [Pirellula sp. SH-Sr6A]